MTTPAVSIVIPFYNAGGQLERAVRSVFGQSFADWELILVDDGSTDGSRAIAAQLIAGESRAKLIFQKNRGVSAARNWGVDVSSTGLITFLDADDEFLPDFIANCLELKEIQPDCALWGTRSYIDKSGRRIEPLSIGLPAQDKAVIEDYLLTAGGFPPIRTGSSIIAKDALIEVGGFPEGVRWGEDLDTWLRLSLKYSFAIRKSFGQITHIGHGGRASWNADARDYPTLSPETEKKYRELMNNPSRVNKLSEYFNWYRLVAASDCLRLGQRNIAKELLVQASSTRRFARRLKSLKIKSLAPAPVMKAAARLRSMF